MHNDHPNIDIDDIWKCVIMTLLYLTPCILKDFSLWYDYVVINTLYRIFL
jgi:hypothetical protein